MDPINVNSTDSNVPAIAGTAVGTAVLGQSQNGPGVSAESQHFDACIANCHSATNSAVAAVNDAGGFGVRGQGKKGVVGESIDADGQGVFGQSVKVWESSASAMLPASAEYSVSMTTRESVFPVKARSASKGESDEFDGVSGISHSKDHAGVSGHNPGGLAGFFDGDVKVTGKIECPTGTVHCFDINISNADCAEEFEVAGGEAIEPGTLMSFGIDGTLCPSLGAYDNKVVGVISGAGEYKPGIVMDKKQGGNRPTDRFIG